MLFTDEQVAFIDIMITNRLLKRKLPPKVAKPALFHSVPEIRLLISGNIERLKKDVNDEKFDLNVIRFFLKKYVDLRPLDEEHSENDGCSRFDRQVLNALRPDGWPNDTCPIKGTGKSGKYQFVKFTPQPTFESL